VPGRKLTKAERTIVSLKPSAVEIFEVLVRLARRFAGKVFPTYDHIMKETGLSRPTVGRALNALEAVGLVIRQQRFRRVKGEGRVTQYRQTSNAYRTSLPARLIKLLPRWLRPAPVPDDHIQREADRLEDQQHMLDGLTCRELARQTLPPGPLAVAFAAFGDRLDAQVASNNLVLNRR
jgi:DNA-binding transcriptional ArsR family regulator